MTGGLRLPLTPHASAEEYLRHAAGHYVAGGCWLAFCAEPPSLCGWSLWGEPDEAEMARMLATGPVVWSNISPVPVLLDVQGLRRADPLAFEAIATWMQRWREQIDSSVTRVAVVHGPGMPGAVAAGFFSVVPLSVPKQVFDDRARALDWLERPGATRLLDLVEIIQEQVGEGPLVSKLAAYLEEHPGAEIGRAAPALMQSTRSLQRHLRASGTTFRQEVDAARVRVAQRLLRDSSASLKRIALEVGCASQKDLGRAFKRATSESLADWRRRILGESGPRR